MQFRNKFERVIQKSNTGSPIKVIKAGKLDAKKNVVVVPKGEKNLYSEINSFANSVDIHVLLQRFANGDKEALMQRAGAFIDVSAMPTNINDFVNLYKDGENLFNTLPVEIKEKFNNNMVEFITKIGDKEWMEIMSNSPADIKTANLEATKKAEKAHKDAAKVQFANSVYGDQTPVEEPKPVLDPIQEVKNAL